MATATATDTAYAYRYICIVYLYIFKKTATMSRRQRPCQEDGDHVKRTALFKKTATVDFSHVKNAMSVCLRVRVCVSEYKPTCV